jgi:glycosyltransferase involved in cell wall biosynthesis
LTRQEPRRVGGHDAGTGPRFLVFAYACEPDRGGESEAGWLWSRMLARLGETWVITRRNNRKVIEAEVDELPERDNLHFVYTDLPAWARFWKRGLQGARVYYMLWQWAALRKAIELRRMLCFDAVWHLTWANAWLGSVGALLPEPFVYGPVGGCVPMPWTLLPAVGVRGTLFEIRRSLARGVGRHLNPLARLAWSRAELILAQNGETLHWLPARHQQKAVVFSHAVVDQDGADESSMRGGSTALYVGRLIPWKGISLAIRALALLPGWRLVIAGRGPDEGRLKKLARRLAVDHRVEFAGWLPRQQVRSLMLRADTLLFPSLHDEGPFAVAEALAAGLPVACIERGGPPVIGGVGVPPTTVRRTAKDLARTVATIAGVEPRSFPSISSHTRRLEELLQQRFPDLQARDRITSQSPVPSTETGPG